MESKIDYITMTLKPVNSSIHLSQALDMLRKTMLLNDLIDKMTVKRCGGFYDFVLTYENISLLQPNVNRFSEQGICIRISSLGLDYLVSYLKSYNVTLKEWLGFWRGLSFGGMYITKFTRFDYAMDDICFNDEPPCITLDKLIKCAAKGEICKKARTVDVYNGDEISTRSRMRKVDGEMVTGKTLYIGVRGNCEKLIRFYDKRAEQLQQKKEIPEGCSSWTRCEAEFTGSAAISAVNAFLDFSENDFAEYMCGVLNNQCRFIVRNNENISRCPVKRWWAKFLNGCTSCFRLPHKAPVRSCYARASRGLRQYVRTIFTLFQEIGLEGIYRFFEDEVNLLKLHNKETVRPELINNIRDGIHDYEKMTAFKYYSYCSEESEPDITDHIKNQLGAYFHKLYVAEHSDEIKERHNNFMGYRGDLINGL